MEQDIDTNKYILKFGIAYIIGLIALAAIFHFLDLNGGSGASIGVLIGAAMYSVGKFIEENKRIPNKKEKSKLVWFSLLASWATSIILLIIVVLALEGLGGFSELAKLALKLNVIVIIGIIFFVSAIYFLVLSWCYGGLANKQYEGLRKKGKI